MSGGGRGGSGRIDKEKAREYQQRSVKARSARAAERKKQAAINKSLSATVREILNKPVTDPKQLAEIERVGLPADDNPTYGEFLAASMVWREIQRGRAADYKQIMGIIGEAPPTGAGNDEQEKALQDLIAAIKNNNAD